MTKILDTYTNPAQPGSFLGLTGFLKNNKGLKKAEVKKQLLGQETYTLHTPLRKKFPRTQWLTSGIDHIWQIDLVDLKKFKYENSHYEYILTCIDIFSKKAWVYPIKKKTPAETSRIFQKIFTQGRIPKIICLDKGNEFKGECKKLFDKNKIQIITSKTRLKAAVIERFNRTIRAKMFRVFTFRKNKKYIDILDKLVESYNNSYHRSIKTTPNSVFEKDTGKISKILYGDSDTFSWDNYIQFKYHKGDFVRMSLEKNIFEKGYTPNFSKEIYMIFRQLASKPPRYNIMSLDGIEFDYNFYTEELQKVIKTDFPYDMYKIHEQMNDKLLVEKLNSKNYSKKWCDKNKFLNK